MRDIDGPQSAPNIHASASGMLAGGNWGKYDAEAWGQMADCHDEEDEIDEVEVYGEGVLSYEMGAAGIDPHVLSVLPLIVSKRLRSRVGKVVSGFSFAAFVALRNSGW